MEYMNLLLFEATGHCVAAFTRSTPDGKSPPPLSPQEAVGEALHNRDLDSGGAVVDVAADLLESVVVPLDARVLEMPTLFAQAQGLLEEQRGNAIAPVLATQYNASNLEVHNAFQGTEVWVLIAGPGLSMPILRKLEIPEDENNPLALLDATDSLSTLRAGTYDTLIFAPGIRVVRDQIVVP